MSKYHVGADSSLAESQSATTVLARMDYAVKRFLWL